MAHAIVAIEDKRFYSEPGIDYRGIIRAFVADVFHTGSGIQGASTITEQFVKNALNDQKNRTIFNKLREAALAFQLSHLWSKDKILSEYLDTAYFGSGAYGVEAAARAYFGNDPSSNLFQCGRVPNTDDPASLCVTNLSADQAALLAAAVDAPSEFNFLNNANAARDRRNLVLRDMAEQHYLTPTEAAGSPRQTSLPPPEDVASPSEEAMRPERRLLRLELGRQPAGVNRDSRSKGSGRARRSTATGCTSTRRSTTASSAPPRAPSRRSCRRSTGRPGRCARGDRQQRPARSRR